LEALPDAFFTLEPPRHRNERTDIMTNLKPESKPPALLTAREVARQLGVSVAWVLQHASGTRRPAVPSIKMGKAVRFRQMDIDTFVEHCRRCMAHGIPIT
jgi:predicted DNA-binding transcriptional regulator AlpA